MDSTKEKCAVCGKDAEYRYEDVVRPAYKCGNHLAFPISKYTKLDLDKPIERYNYAVPIDAKTDYHYIAGKCYIFWAYHVISSEEVKITVHECPEHWVVVTWT